MVANVRFWLFPPKTAWNFLKENKLDRGWGHASPAPPWIRQCVLRGITWWGGGVWGLLTARGVAAFLTLKYVTFTFLCTFGFMTHLLTKTVTISSRRPPNLSDFLFERQLPFVKYDPLDTFPKNLARYGYPCCIKYGQIGFSYNADHVFMEIATETLSQWFQKAAFFTCEASRPKHNRDDSCFCFATFLFTVAA